MLAQSTWAHDLFIVSLVALITSVVRSYARLYFERAIPEWSKLDESVKSRLAVEVGVVPSRIVLFYLTLPLVLAGFSPMESWTADDTATSLTSCAILTGSYIIDLTVTRNDKASTLHHVMGPALLLWIRLCFSSFTSSDALLCRLLIQFVFFGATISGATTTALVFLYQFRKSWFRSSTSNAYYCFTLLLPVLAFSTIASTFYCTIYLLVWFDEVFAYFGHWGYLPLGWVLIECGMQWKWLMWFYKFDEWYRTTTYDNPEESDELKKKMAGVATAAWWLPKWRFAAIRCLAAAWFATVLGVTWKTGDVQFLARQFASFVSNAWQEAFGLGWNRFKIQEHVEL
ncbi:uncharacterized protein TRIREDRAFT_112114 [Trichoderma reesei QM6a]|uniref:Predicted protein n=2 Tax=Hypocrea jecorina TaxID=51453 RepID=G0RW88_HYPJQ|nr:uncharacterized protein TRIREDRAFT_112114 [Trichoderma reesei QM6a]EGR44508.1 predicted protein [Trichoderma reesei QM6a]ETR97359.1 hypothetical protein M419DRAFT_39409 [Trichoderma reesei RUT C-30]